MPPDLGIPFPLDFAGIPPHMSSIDFVLWQRFRQRNILSALRLYFDVAVGRGAEAGSEVAENLRAAWQRITRSRIDVVSEGVVGWTLFEIRGSAGPGALGSILLYRDLWLADPPDRREITLVLVTDLVS